MEKDLPQNEDPQLPGVSRKVPLEVPEGYFDTLTNRIMAQLPDTPAARVAWWQQWRTWRIAAPAMLVVLAAGLWLLKPATSTEQDNFLAGVSEEALLGYLEESLDPEDVLYYDLVAYTEVSDDIREDLWGGSLEEGAEDYLDDLSLEELEALGEDILEL